MPLATETARSVVSCLADTARSIVMTLAETDLSTALSCGGRGRTGNSGTTGGLGALVSLSLSLSSWGKNAARRCTMLSMCAEISFIFSKSSRFLASRFSSSSERVDGRIKKGKGRCDNTAVSNANNVFYSSKCTGDGAVSRGKTRSMATWNIATPHRAGSFNTVSPGTPPQSKRRTKTTNHDMYRSKQGNHT